MAVSTFRSLRVRNYRIWFCGQLVSVCGSWMQTVAQGWLVLRLSHDSGFAVGLVTALQFLPMLLFGAWGGVIADRFDKRRTLVAAQSALAVIAAVQAAVTLSGAVRLWMVYALVVVQGFANLVDIPVRQSFPNEMVSGEDLSNALSLNSALFNSARIIGPAVAGPLIVTAGVGWCFFVNSVSYLAVLASLLLMRRAELYPTTKAKRGRRQIREGLAYVRRTPALGSVLLLSAVVGTLAINFNVVLPLLAKKTFHGTARTYSAMTVAMGVGALIGALTTATRKRATPEFLCWSAVMMGLAMCAAAWAPTLHVALVLIAFVGLCQVAFVSTGQAILQLASAEEMRGRVVALRAITVMGSTPIGGPIIGWISGINARWGLVVGGVASLLGAGGYGMFLRQRKRAFNSGVAARIASPVSEAIRSS